MIGFRRWDIQSEWKNFCQACKLQPPSLLSHHLSIPHPDSHRDKKWRLEIVISGLEVSSLNRWGYYLTSLPLSCPVAIMTIERKGCLWGTEDWRNHDSYCKIRKQAPESGRPAAKHILSMSTLLNARGFEWLSTIHAYIRVQWYTTNVSRYPRSRNPSHIIPVAIGGNGVAN